MLPIKDTIRSQSVPLVNWLIILVNFLVFLYEISLPPLRLGLLINQYGLVPAHLNLADPFTWGALFTHMFLHGGWLHILSNMWVLFIFGDNVEDRLGSVRYLLFYLTGGILAGLVQIFFSTDALTPSIGASGAIAAVLGGYFSFYPRSKVITLIPIFIIPWFVELPSFVFLGFWFITQLFQGLIALTTPNGQAVGGVAWWAHIGGFIFGLLFVRLFAIGHTVPRWHSDQFWPW